LEGILQGQRVHDGRQHAHVVGGGALHAARARGDPTEDVAAADDDRDLHAEFCDLADLRGDPLEHEWIDPVALASGERLPRKLQDDAAVGRSAGAGSRRHDYPPSPTWNRAKRLTTIRSPVLAFTVSTSSRILVLPEASLMNGCSSRH